MRKEDEGGGTKERKEGRRKVSKERKMRKDGREDGREGRCVGRKEGRKDGRQKDVKKERREDIWRRKNAIREKKKRKEKTFIFRLFFFWSKVLARVPSHVPPGSMPTYDPRPRPHMLPSVPSLLLLKK